MKKLLTFEISYSSPIPFALLHNEVAINQLTERFFFKDSLIYFITKIKKVRFDLSSLKIIDNNLQMELLYNDKIYPASLKISEKKITISNDSNSKVIIINVEGEDNEIYLTPDLVLRSCKIEIGNKPELIYIGFSIAPIRRLLNHEKIIKALNEICDDEELRLYVSSFKFSYCEQTEKKVLICIEDIGIKKDLVKNKVLKEYVTLVERILINYFQTDSLNDNHINMDLNKDILLKNILIKNDIRFLGGGYIMEEGEYFDFYSKNRKEAEKLFFIDLDNLNDEYITYDDAMDRFLNQ